jgi:curved DNA-binding protein CbpA
VTFKFVRVLLSNSPREFRTEPRNPAARATMKTLYDLLGALPHDDAEALRTAFRRAVKGAHPDIRPGDPSAALRFRQIMRANKILGDADERAAYDHLLELARLEQVSASKHAVAATIHKLASGVLALAGASVATLGGYLLFIHISAASVDQLDNLSARATAEIAALSSAVSPDTTGLSTSLARRESASIRAEAIAPGAAAVTSTDAKSVGPADLGPSVEIAASEARSLRARGMTAYRNGDLKRAIADLDHALQLDPKFLPAYIDRGIISYRQRKFGRAYAEIAKPRRIEKATRSRSAPAARKPRVNQAGTATSVAWSQAQTVAQDPSHGDGFASVMR